ncbi:DUF3465 domain-containing protein [Halomonas sp. PR-M31]|uniref:DUF3465 domain-containing protein n=1 Tax=Halomonas sp. PR-M31 TaxID=1471202 RepID=UPI0006510E96|nr:DUF3465 domain-containing protein [Halomonas sp. PR-M31]
MKKLLIALIIGFTLHGVFKNYSHFAQVFTQQSATGDQQITNAFQNRQSDLQVAGSGVVVHLLPDDRQGSRHQRFILELATGQTLLIAHNIDLSSRIDALRKGDTVEFHGEYEWNPKGGVVHWTHRDPGGRHVNGWLKHEGKIYQ